MTKQQLPATRLDPEIVLDGLAEKARAYARASRSENTLRAYESDLRAFCRWCDQRGLTCLPATVDTVSLYIADVADKMRPASLQRRLAAISVAHKAAGYDVSPTSHEVVKSVLSGIRREIGVSQTQKLALSLADVRRLVSDLDDERVIDIRDRALILVGFGGALRRSELVALDVNDVTFEDEGIVLTLRRSKTNQDGKLEQVPISRGSNPSTCPVRALQTWLAQVNEGPIFRSIDRHGNVGGRLSDHAVALILKRHAQRVGLDAKKLAGHSLRSGFATTAARAGKSEASIMRQTRHRSVTVARRYIRQATIWDDHAGFGIGL
jgi:site-specific recombinase XerD